MNAMAPPYLAVLLLKLQWLKLIGYLAKSERAQPLPVAWLPLKMLETI